jgi:hypothetical protein
MVLQELGEGAIKVGNAIGEGAVKAGQAINKGISTTGHYLKEGLSSLYNGAREYIPKIGAKLSDAATQASMALQAYMQNRMLQKEEEQLANQSQAPPPLPIEMPAPQQYDSFITPGQYVTASQPINPMAQAVSQPVIAPKSMAVFLFDENSAVPEFLEEVNTPQDAEKEVEKLRKLGLPAFYTTLGEYLLNNRLRA